MARASAIFDADDARMLDAMKRIDQHLLDMEGKFGRFFNLLKGGFALTGIGIGIHKVIDGIKGQLDLGSELQNIHMQTGLAVDDIMKLRYAFKSAGIEADSIGPVMAQMMKSIEAGSGASIIGQLGLDFEKIRKMNPSDQFTEIGKAINALPSIQQRATAAMEIFGKKGEKLLSLFGGKDFGKDSAELGAQAKILGENAAVFSEVTSDLDIVGDKIKGLWLGMASEIAPVLLPILDQLKQLDFTSFGKQLGASVAYFLEAWNEGRLGEFIQATMTYSLLHAADAFGRAMIGIIHLLGEQLMETMSGKAALLGPLFKAARGDLVGAAVDFYRQTDKQQRDSAGRAGDAYKQGYGDKTVLPGLAEMDKYYEKLGASLAKNLSTAQAAARGEAKESNTGLGDDNIFFGARPNVSALTRIGGNYGGGSGDPLLNESRRQTQYLSTIAAGISKLIIPSAHPAHSGLPSYL